MIQQSIAFDCCHCSSFSDNFNHFGVMCYVAACLARDAQFLNVNLMVVAVFTFISLLLPSLLWEVGSFGGGCLAAGFLISGDEFTDRGFISHAPEIGSTVDRALSFEPNQLNFGASSLGIPKRSAVVVYNPNNVPVEINAISSKSLDFYFSFPENKIVKPLGKSRFIVTYLPRSEGKAATTLNIHTSVGTEEFYVVKMLLQLFVSAYAHGNPYRIRPVIKARLPVNGTFEFPIVLHNPHIDKLRLINAFSSDPELTLIHKKHEDTQLVGKQTSSVAYSLVLLQEIAPFETVNFAQAVAVGATERNVSVFIVLKLDAISYSTRSVKHRVLLVMTVDMEVTTQPGLFSTVDVLDFGLIKYGERSQRMIFNAYSTVEKGIEIDSVYVDRTSHQTNGVYLQFASKPPISVKSRAKSQPGAPVPISNIEIDTSYLSLNSSQKMHVVQGEIVAESRGGNFNATIRFYAVVFFGFVEHILLREIGVFREVLHSSKDAVFHHSLQPPIHRSISLQNNYPFGIAVWNVSLPESKQKIFKVSMVRPVVEIEAGKSSAIIRLKYIKKAQVNFTATCLVHTNVTTFEVPLLIFKGDIKVLVNSVETDRLNLNFGLVKANTKREMFFTVVNPNSVAIILRGLSNVDDDLALVEPVGTEYGNGSLLSDLDRILKPQSWISVRISFSMSGADFALPANSFTVFRVSLTIPPYTKTSKSLSLRVATDYETIDVPVEYKLTNSTVVFVDNLLRLDDSSPGKISTRDIRLYSSFERDLKVLRVSKLTNDQRFFFQLKSKKELWIKSGTTTTLGSLSFAPGLTCAANCYVGLPLHTAGDGQWFKHGLKLPPDLPEIDSYLYSRLRRRFNALESKSIRTSVIVDTDEFKSLELGVRTELTWPRLLDHPVVHFPLTAVGNFTILNLTLSNPSIHPVVVQLLPLVTFFEDELVFPIDAPVEMNETLMFSLRDTELFTLKAGSPVPKLREQLEEVVGSPIPRFTLSMLLQPGMSVRVRIGFLPTDYTLRSSLLLIRNNLTAIEPVVMYGKGAHVNMEIDGKASRSNFLLFDILPSHLSDCHNPKRLTHKLPTTLTVKRTFVVKNTGEVNFTIMNVSISGTSCEDRGFRVLNCQPFSLSPNETHSLEIAYTPDFLMSVNEAALQLYMHMNGTPWVFDMVATIAPEMLHVCHSALPRPPFEWVMYYSCLFALVFCMVYVSACAYLEGDHFISCLIQQSLEALSEKGIITPISEKTDGVEENTSWREAISSRIAILSRLVRGPNEPPILCDFGTKPLPAFGAKIVNYVLWFFATMRQVVTNDSRLPQRRHRRNRRRSPPLTNHNSHVTESTKPIVVATRMKYMNDLESLANTANEPTIDKEEYQPNKLLENGFNGRRNQVGSDHEQTSNVKKRKNVTKKKSDDGTTIVKSEAPPVQYVKPVTKIWRRSKQSKSTKVDEMETEEVPLMDGEAVDQTDDLSLQQNGINGEVDEQMDTADLLAVEPESVLASVLKCELSDNECANEDIDQQLAIQDDEKAADSSESSGVPEWADASVLDVNVNEEFDQMVEQASAFKCRPNSPLSCSSQSPRFSQSDNIPTSSTSVEEKKRKRRRQRKQAPPQVGPRLTSREINRLAKEYKQYLEAMANGMPLTGFPVGFLPPTLTVNPNVMNPPGFGNQFAGFLPPSSTNDGYYDQLLRFQQQQQQEEELQRQMVINRQRSEQLFPDSYYPNASFPWMSQPQQQPIPTARSPVQFPPVAVSMSQEPTTTNNKTNFDALTTDLFNELTSARSPTAEHETPNLLDLVPEAETSNSPTNRFFSLYTEDRIWQPIGEAGNSESLWPNWSEDIDVDRKEK
ncbi:hypothetical protein M3Y94_00347300 [Aphelenchoides besseyi]|nr:hypothetical protein M3Y94_00347300 [Aphelenchoides besseyi]